MDFSMSICILKPSDFKHCIYCRNKANKPKNKQNGNKQSKQGDKYPQKASQSGCRNGEVHIPVSSLNNQKNIRNNIPHFIHLINNKQ